MTTPNQPGWYDDPHDPNAQRYWDGQDWTPTRQRKPNVGATRPPVMPAPAQPPPPPPAAAPMAAAPSPMPIGPPPYSPPPGYYPSPQPPQSTTAPNWTATKTMALCGLCFGGLSFLLDFFLGVGIAIAVPAAIVGFLAWRRAKKYNEPATFPLWSFIVPVASIIFWLVVIVLIMGMLGAASTIPSTPYTPS
jgi:hypothetical protein